MLDIELGGGRVADDPFRAFFEQATWIEEGPYPYQKALAAVPIESRLIHVLTGRRKTAAAMLAWLWQRKTSPDTTPQRLVYCLPMRVPVEQGKSGFRLLCTG